MVDQNETRTTSASGGEKGVKPQRMDLIPWNPVRQISEVYAFGAEKYADHNWRKGYEWSKSYAAMMRHLTAYWEGEDNDPESGLPHLAHAGFHVFALLEGAKEHPEYDDRYKKPKQIATSIDFGVNPVLLANTQAGEAEAARRRAQRSINPAGMG